MSDGSSSEEKTLPPSQKKLKDLRDKGQIARSSDMVSGLATSLAFVYIWLNRNSFSDRFKEASNYVASLPTDRFDLAAAQGSKAMALAFAPFLAGLILVVLSSVILANFIVNKGIVFSVDAMKFDFNKLNPVEGFKKIFSLRSIVELAKNLTKFTLFSAACTFILLYSLNPPFQIPFCGEKCVTPVITAIVSPIIILAVGLFLVSGMADIGLQRWLFIRQNRMTKTEAKRDRKEQEGSPEVKGAQKRARQGLLQMSSKYLPEDSTMFVEGGGYVIGVRFVRNETPLPVIVCKGRGGRGFELLRSAYDNKIPIYSEEEFAANLFRKSEAGGHLAEQFFEPFIKGLRATGVDLRLLRAR
jgi:type III secretion protein U